MNNKRKTVIAGITYVNDPGFPPAWENPAVAEDADNRMAQVHAMRGPQRETLPCGCKGEPIAGRGDGLYGEFLRECPVCHCTWLERPDY
jgi:hypothetical protein